MYTLHVRVVIRYMKIAILLRKLSEPGGAEYSMFTLGKFLQTDHDVKIFGQIGNDTERGQSLHATWKLHRAIPHEFEILSSYATTLIKGLQPLNSYNPDLILTQNQPALIGAVLSYLHDTPHIVFFRDYESLPNNEYDQNPVISNINRSLSHIKKRVLCFICEHSDLVLAVSEFTADQYRKSMGIDPIVVYDFISDSMQNNTLYGEKIVHVTPTRAKGINVTLDIAERMPEREFMIVGSSPSKEVESRIHTLSNVTYNGYVETMSRVYNEAKFVIVPSKWNEPFGRVVVEAGLHKTPALCSANGGLPESVGYSEFVVNSNNPEGYIQQIQKLDNKYERARQLAYENAKSKRAETQLDRFKSIANSRANIQI